MHGDMTQVRKSFVAAAAASDRVGTANSSGLHEGIGARLVKESPQFCAPNRYQ